MLMVAWMGRSFAAARYCMREFSIAYHKNILVVRCQF